MDSDFTEYPWSPCLPDVDIRMKDLRISKDFASSQIIVNQSTNENKIEQEKQLRTQFSKAQASNDSAWNSSVLRVLFKNETFARKYRVRIEKFLKDLLDEGEEFVVYHPTRSNGEQEFEDNYQTFQIDKIKGESCEESEVLQKVPFYSATYEDTLNCNIEVTDEKNAEGKPPMMTCFNCLGNHHMKKCPEKLDRGRINANKKEILLGNTIRYHNDEQNSSLKPGKLSDNLRNALGLKKNQLPQFIYHMRVIGYPPGWMNEAVFEKSGLSLYDSEGKAVLDEPSMSSSATGTMYDGTKFIDFPGFNTPVPEGFKDEWKDLNMPPLQAHQQLKEALKSPNIIINSNANKRKQIQSDKDIDSKKLKNVAEQTSSPLTKVKVTENDCTSPEHRRKICDFKTPESMQTNKRHSMSLSMSPGTPVLEQGNPFYKLPEAHKFAQGITEHLPFENLPDSVGTFEKMRGVISSVQEKLNNIKKS